MIADTVLRIDSLEALKAFAEVKKVYLDQQLWVLEELKTIQRSLNVVGLSFSGPELDNTNRYLTNLIKFTERTISDA